MIDLNFSVREIIDKNYILDENLNNSFISGNKIRKLKGILSIEKQLTGLLTFGSPYSSHCLATAYFGMVLGIPVKLIVLTDNSVDTEDFPHLKMAKKMKADIEYCRIEDASSYIEKTKQKYPSFLWIPGGGHVLIAANQYEFLFDDLAKIYPEIFNKINSIILPLGTGTTALGVYKSIRKTGLDIKVIGVTVSRPAEKCKDILSDMDSNIDFTQFEIIDDYSGLYDLRTEATEIARLTFLRKTGVLVDPIYNAKSIECLYRYNLKNTLIINTGGMLNNFI